MEGCGHNSPVINNEFEIIRDLECVVPQSGRAQHIPTVTEFQKIISDFLAFGFWMYYIGSEVIGTTCYKNSIDIRFLNERVLCENEL